MLIGCAIYMLLDNGDGETFGAILDRSGPALAGFAALVGIDELPIGFTAGLLRVAVLPVVAVIAANTLILWPLGMRCGERIGQRVAGPS